MSGPFDLVGPFRGPCAFCGFEDARHRVADSIRSMVAAGDKPAAVAEDFGLTLDAVWGLCLPPFLPGDRVRAVGRLRRWFRGVGVVVGCNPYDEDWFVAVRWPRKGMSSHRPEVLQLEEGS